ncbi:MAG: PilZ domain-containing protein [Acidobacteria bacterium]|nr:PilZ domain-containing protein [Acidobacteriota bacterium]MCL5289384.1 PilZ domain-containing protein [Acidobacteriota bacterium]
MKTDNRLYDRLYLTESQYVKCEGVGFAFTGRITVIGLGGLYILTDKSYPMGTVLALRVSVGAEVVEADGIVRDVEPDGFGVEWVKLRGANEDALMRIMNRLRAA